MGIHSPPIYHTDLPHSVSTAVFEHAQGQRHMDSKLACRGIWFLLELNPVSPQGTSTPLHLKTQKMLSPGNNIFFKSLDLENSSKNRNDYLPKSFCVAPVRSRFGILRQWDNDNDRLSALLCPAYFRGRFKLIHFQGISRRQSSGACNSRLIRGFVYCWPKKIYQTEGKDGVTSTEEFPLLVPLMWFWWTTRESTREKLWR